MGIGMPMNCEVDYCIYNDDYECILSEIRINSLGMCEECILVSIPNAELKFLKNKLRKQLEKTESV